MEKKCGVPYMVSHKWLNSIFYFLNYKEYLQVIIDSCQAE